jgi:hypothetical protein
MDNDSFSHDQDILDILKGVESQKVEYPPELLAARKKLFIEQVEQHTQLKSASDLVEKDHKLLNIFRSWKSVEPEYPSQMLARRRSLFKQRIAESIRNSVWHVLHSSLRNIFAGWVTSHRSTSRKFGPASALALAFAMAAFAAYAMYGNAIRSASPFLAQNQIFTPTSVSVTSTAQVAIIICSNGYEPPLCLSNEFDNRQHLTYAGNGKARPAVAKDSYSGSGQIHRAAHVNDGLYGPDASWVSDSPNSWVKIDLGTTTAINTVAFGRDRLGSLNDGDPGRFLIAVATSDDVYADGNSSNDGDEYVQVYDSKQAGFDGKISGAETVIALFDLKRARFIKITFENAHTAIDEVEAFVTDPSVAAFVPTKAPPRENSHPVASTPLAVYTPLPTDTAIAIPIDTLPPTETVTPMPTDPPTPVETPIPIDTPTPIEPTVAPAVDTPIPVYTPVSLPSDEAVPTDGPIGPGSDDWIDPIREGP